MKIEDFGYNGEGVGKINGKPCFVPYCLVGEEVKITIKKQTSSYIKAAATVIEKASPIRKDAPCPYFGKCGGCDFQHMNYDNEIILKTKILERHTEKLSKGTKFTVVKSPKEYHYRNKIKMSYKNGVLGLRQKGDNEIIKINNCFLIDEKMNKILQKIQDFIKKNKSKNLDSVTLREVNDKIAVIFAAKGKLDLDVSWLDFVLGKNIGIFVQEGDKIKHISGFEKFEAEEESLKVSYSPEAFHQINDDVYKLLYRDVLQNIKGQKVINAYSGGGTLSGMIAMKGKTVFGVELGKAEHETAQALKEINRLETLTNIQGDCAKVIPILERCDTIVLDPPRRGCAKEVCQAVNSSGAERIIYVSCEPSTLVRDLKLLNNYKLTKMTMFDMFPRTANMETLSILDKVKENNKN